MIEIGVLSMAVLWGVLVAINPSRALGVMIFALPSYLIRLSLGGLPTTVLEILMVVFCVVVIVVNRERAWQHVTRLWSDMGRPGRMLSACFVLASCAGVIVAPNIWGALGLWRAYVLEPIVFVCCAYPYLCMASTRRSMAQGGLALLVVLVSIAVYQAITRNFIPYPWWQAGDIRATGVFEYPNALALLTVPLAFLVGAWGGKARGVVAIGCAAVCCLLAQSAGGIVALLAGLCIGGTLNRKTRQWVVVMVVIVALVMCAWQPLRERVVAEGMLRGDSGPARQIIWSNTVAMMRDHPLLGVGFGGYQEGVAPYHRERYIEIYQYPHNSVLTTWSEMGVLGVIAYHGLLVWAMCMVWVRGQRDIAGALLVGAGVAIAVHGLVDVPYFKNDLALLWWVLIACVVASREQGVPDKI